MRRASLQSLGTGVRTRHLTSSWRSCRSQLPRTLVVLIHMPLPAMLLGIHGSQRSCLASCLQRGPWGACCLSLSCCQEEDFCLLGAYVHLAMGSTLPSTSWFLCGRGESSPLEAAMLLFPVSQRAGQTAGDTGQETHFQSEEGMQRLP